MTDAARARAAPALDGRAAARGDRDGARDARRGYSCSTSRRPTSTRARGASCSGSSRDDRAHDAADHARPPARRRAVRAHGDPRRRSRRGGRPDARAARRRRAARARTTSSSPPASTSRRSSSGPVPRGRCPPSADARSSSTGLRADVALMRFPALHARAVRLRESVIARLLLTLVLALGAVGTFQYFVVGGRVEQDLIREHAAVHAADTRALEHRAEAAAGDRYSSPLSEVSELLSALAERPDTDDVVVTDKEGAVIASPIAGQVGTYRTDPLLRKVARTGRPVAGVPDGNDRHAYIERAAAARPRRRVRRVPLERGAGLGRRLVPRRDRPVRSAEPADRAPALLRARRPQRRRALPLRPAARAPRRAHRPRQPSRLPGRARARRRRVRALRHVGDARAARHRRLQVRERPPRPPARRPPAVRALRAAARQPRRRPRVPPRRRRVRPAARPHRRGRGGRPPRPHPQRGRAPPVGRHDQHRVQRGRAPRTASRARSGVVRTPRCSRPSAAGATRSSPPPRSSTACPWSRSRRCARCAR